MNGKKILASILLAGALLMAIERIGTEVVQSSVVTGSASVTVPSDCTFVLLLMNTFGPNAPPDYVRINGIDFTKVIDWTTDFDHRYTHIYRLSNPSTGVQTFSWSWGGVWSGNIYCLVYFKGVDTTSPIRDSDSDYDIDSSVVLTTAAGDLVVGIVGDTSGSDPNAAPAGSGQTEIIDSDEFNGLEASVGEELATGASVTFNCTGSSYETLCACTLIPAAGGNIYNESITVFSTPALACAASADLLGSVGLASTPAAVMAAVADFLLNLTLTSNPAWSAIGGSDFYNSVAFSSAPALSEAAFKDAFGELSLPSNPAFTAQNIASLLAAVGLSSNPALQAAAVLDILLAIALTSNPAFSVVGGSDFYNAIALASDPALAAAVFKAAFPSLSLASVPALSIAAQADLLASILAASSPEFLAICGFDFIEALIFASGGAIALASELTSGPIISIGAKRAAAGMTRRAIEAAAKKAPGALRRDSR